MPVHRHLRLAFCTALVAAAAATPPAALAEPLSLAAALEELADQAIVHSRERGYGNVGVLHFLVAKKKGGKTPPLSEMTKPVGSINHLLAKRFEIALVLANDDLNPVGVIDDASKGAEQTAGAALLDAAGRARLATRRYRLHWGDQSVRPDAFFTGLLYIEEDLRTATISLFAFSTAGGKTELYAVAADRTIKVGAELMPEIGESFSLSRGAFSGGFVDDGSDGDGPDDLPDDLDPAAGEKAEPAPDVDDEEALTAAEAARTDETKHPLNSPDAEVRVKLFYNDRPVTPTRRDGVATIPEPKTGQAVRIVLTKDRTPNRYGVCVKVNGESTFVRSRRPDAGCGKWILSRPGQAVEVTGFTDAGGGVELFEVLSRAESERRREEFGKDVGQITVTVFPEGKASGPPASYQDRKQDAIVGGKLPAKRPASPAAFKSALLDYANASSRGGKTRGLLVAGENDSRRVKTVAFTAGPKPVMSLSLVYYKP